MPNPPELRIGSTDSFFFIDIGGEGSVLDLVDHLRILDFLQVDFVVVVQLHHLVQLLVCPDLLPDILLLSVLPDQLIDLGLILLLELHLNQLLHEVQVLVVLLHSREVLESLVELQLHLFAQLDFDSVVLVQLVVLLFVHEVALLEKPFAQGTVGFQNELVLLVEIAVAGAAVSMVANGVDKFLHVSHTNLALVLETHEL